MIETHPLVKAALWCAVVWFLLILGLAWLLT